MARLAPSEVCALWVKYSPRVPARFALGSATHESDLSPTSVSVGDQHDGASSEGLYQLSSSPLAEGSISDMAIRALLLEADFLDAEDNTKVYAAICEMHLDSILDWANKSLEEAIPLGLWAYLGMSHNMGTGAAKKTILKHGLDWEAYKERNPTLAIVAKGYGDDCISGGHYWTPDLEVYQSTGGSALNEVMGRLILVGLVGFITAYYLAQPLLRAYRGVV